MGTEKPYRIETEREIIKARKKLILMLGWEVAKHEIGKAIMKEFIGRGLDKVYIKEIEAWKKYKREKIFAKKLTKEMKEEIKRFRKTIKGWELKELEIVWDIIPH